MFQLRLCGGTGGEDTVSYHSVDRNRNRANIVRGEIQLYSSSLWLSRGKAMERGYDFELVSQRCHHHKRNEKDKSEESMRQCRQWFVFVQLTAPIHRCSNSHSYRGDIVAAARTRKEGSGKKEEGGQYRGLQDQFASCVLKPSAAIAPPAPSVAHSLQHVASNALTTKRKENMASPISCVRQPSAVARSRRTDGVVASIVNQFRPQARAYSASHPLAVILHRHTCSSSGFSHSYGQGLWLRGRGAG